MAGEIQVPYGVSGRNVYALVRNSAGQVWNGIAFVTYATANLSSYAINLAQQGTASGFYVGNMPSIANGVYGLVAYDRAGGAPAESDTLIGTESMQWSGWAVIALPPLPAAVGSQMNLTDGAITDAKITMPAEAAGRPSTALAIIRRAWEWISNKRDRNSSTGDMKLYGADNVTVLESQTQSTVGATDSISKGA